MYIYICTNCPPQFRQKSSCRWQVHVAASADMAAGLEASPVQMLLGKSLNDPKDNFTDSDARL